MKNSKDFNKIPLSTELCEFIGAHIGDGYANKYIITCGKTKEDKIKYCTRYHIQFSGHSKNDLDYYKNKIIPIANKLFDINPYTRIIGNTLRINFFSKKLIFMLKDRFGIPIGKKSHTVKIPEEILNSNKKYLFATIRGIFDTDGCVFIDKREIYLKPYPRITLQIMSKPLYFQLKKILEKYFTLYTRINEKRQNTYIEVYGSIQIGKWMKLIGFSNKYHLLKLQNASMAQAVERDSV